MTMKDQHPADTKQSQVSNQASSSSQLPEYVPNDPMSRPVDVSLSPTLLSAFANFAKEFERVVQDTYRQISFSVKGSLYSPKNSPYCHHYYYCNKKRVCHYIKVEEKDRYQESISKGKDYLRQWKALEIFYSAIRQSFAQYPGFISQECITLLEQGKDVHHLPFLTELPQLDSSAAPASSGFLQYEQQKIKSRESLIHLVETNYANIQVIRNPKPFHPESLTCCALSGEKIRSLNEVVIVNELYHAGLEYIYEPLLYVDGTQIFPDFLVRIPETNDIVLWEHFGMMDNEDYVQKAAEKIARYALLGFCEGKNLIITCTGEKDRMNSLHVHRIIECYFLSHK